MRVLGMSSGTSVDAIDVAVAEFAVSDGVLHLTPVVATELAWESGLRRDILALLPPHTSSVEQWCRVHTLAGQAFGQAARAVMDDHGPVDLISSHGQTVFHWVEDDRARGSLQLGDPAGIHAATGVPVISDLRTADIAAGGEGAPLTSTLDALWLGDRPTVALNLGGIANITVVGTSEITCGDTGPANCLIDAAMNERGEDCDRDGAAAARGHVDETALARLLADPYYARPLPKSTGREYFDSAYVERILGDAAPTGDDLIATLTELTARTIADAVSATGVQRVVVSGGGVRNPVLMRRLEGLLGLPLQRSGDVGLPDDGKEAYLFALLGFLSLHGWPGTIARADGTTVTGARHPVVLGTLTPPAPLRTDRPETLIVEGKLA